MKNHLSHDVLTDINSSSTSTLLKCIQNMPHQLHPKLEAREKAVMQEAEELGHTILYFEASSLWHRKT